ncbi:carbon monoxide dehydrogenase accessory protein CooC [soil metagenome]
MKIAFVGKGGSGKSMIAGTVVRALAQGGAAVLAIDSDPMPGLAWSIGIAPTDEGFPDEAVEEGPEGGPRYLLRLPPEESVERYALRGPDGIRVIQFGKLRGHVGSLLKSQHAFNQVAKGVGDGRWHLVGDLPAGTRQAFSGWASYADTLVAVVEPTTKSIISARRLARMADATGRRDGAHIPAVVAVANKVTEEGDAEEIAERTGLRVMASVPYDDELGAVERGGQPPLDAAPDCPAVRAVVSFAHDLVDAAAAAEEDST